MASIGNGWLPLAADILECDLAEVARRAGTTSFTGLGGTSLRAVEFAALAAHREGLVVIVGALLGPEALAEVMAAARPAPTVTAPPGPTGERPGLRDAARVQQAMLLGERLRGGSAFHLLFSADIRGPLDELRLRAVLARLTRRHASLRTVFVSSADGVPRRRVLPRWEPVVLEQELPALAGDPVEAVHALLGSASGILLKPFEQPPVVFVLSRVDAGRAVLSMLAHHAVVDGWSIGLLWREIAAGYAGEAEPGGVADLEPLVAAEASDAVRDTARRRADAVRHMPPIVTIPSDLVRPPRADLAGTRLIFGLTDQARRACAELAQAEGVTRNAVLFAAWALVVARRAGVPQMIMGLVSSGRTTAESLGVVGPYVKQLPVVCAFPESGSAAGFLGATAAAIRDALDAGDVPAEDVVAALGLGGDDARNPLVQVAFAAHDELVPGTLRGGDLSFDIHEGHCGGTVYDAVLYVRRWGDRTRLALEYATSALRADEAAELAAAFDRTLVEMAAAPSGPLADVRTITDARRRRLEQWGTGPAVDAGAGLWQLFEAAARRHPDRVAVRDTDPARVLTYRQLLRAAEVQSAVLAAEAVGAGDCVALAVRRSTLEIVAILAVLRLGAGYTGIEPGTPEAATRSMLDSAAVEVVIGDDDRLASLAAHGRRAAPLLDPWQAAAQAGPVPVAAGPDPDRVAYVAFTSGSTGTPKGTRVPHRGVVRLTVDAEYLRPGACDRFVRLAPLGFDASTLEIFAPLVSGGTVEVYPEEQLTPDGLATFVQARGITGLWLTAGLFRLVADYRPDAFEGVRQILTGGDVVPAGQVARVLRKCPGIRVTNGYGPTENTTFTTVYHVDDEAQAGDPLPIGRPIPGTGVVVLDPAGRLTPPGGIGELFTYGDGLAHGYAGLPAETARAFGRFSADVDRVLYRTGDVVRWDGAGQLRFLGRRDRQVKIRGFRIELDVVAQALRAYPGVQDAVVVATGPRATDRRLLAGIVAEAGRLPIDALRRFAAEHLPGYAVPSLWAVLPELPVTRNGKLDAARLAEAAVTRDSDDDPAAEGVEPAPADDLARTIARAWQEVLGVERVGGDERFFDVGGDSLQLLRVAASLRRDLPGHDVTIQDLYACQTIDALCGRLRSRSRA